MKSVLLRVLCLALALVLLCLPGCTKNPDEEKTPPDESGTALPAPNGLNVNLLDAPFGVDRNALRFSWVMNAPGNNQTQQAYRIVIAQSLALMEAQTYVHDTDWVTSNQNTAVSIDALASKLADNSLYYWSVAVKNQDGNESAFSAPQAFSTAVGKEWASTTGIWASGAEDAVSDVPTSDDWSDYTVDTEFIIDSAAVGFVLRAANPSNFYMWQFKVDNGTAMLYPHVFKDGKFVGNAAIAKVAVPAEVAFSIGEPIRARMVCHGDSIQTYLADASDDYILIDERDMSDYGFARGVIGVRTGGSESGRVNSIHVYHEDDLLYRSAFAKGVDPFPKSNTADGVLVVSKALSTGDLLDPALLAASTSEHGESINDFCFLRTEFSLDQETLSRLDRAILSVTASSPEVARQYVYTMYVNGSCVGVGPSRLGTAPDGQTVLYYNTYDITALLTAGENCLSAINYALSDRAFLCQLTLHNTDGSHQVLLNSGRDAAQWLTLKGDAAFGKQNSIGTQYYSAHANNIDSALYPHGFAQVGFDDSTWTPAQGTAPIDEGRLLLPSQVDVISRYESSRAAISVSQHKDGSYVVDLGAEIVGSLRLTIDSPSEAVLTVYYGEQLNADGSVKHAMLTKNDYTETWTLTKGKQTIETVDLLTYRYMQIKDSPVPITRDMVCGIEVRAAYSEQASSFDSDNSLLDDLYDLTDHTIRVTTQDLYVDSQSRERLAYEGDLMINLPAAYVFEDDYSIGRFTAEYLYTHRTWPAEYLLFCPIMALEDYMTTADATSLHRYYDILCTKNYTDLLDPDDQLLTAKSTTSSQTDAILIDWPSGERDGYDMSVKYNTVYNAVAVLSYESMAKIASIVGKSADATNYEHLADTLRQSMIDQLYDADRGAFSDGLCADGEPSTHFSQHATAYALACGIYSDEDMAAAMASTIKEQGEIKMSVYGAYFLLRGLYESGHGDVANALLLDPTVEEGKRTWAYMLYELDATITTEAWGPAYKNNMTFSHPWGAAPAYAIAQGIFGIRPTSAGYATFDIRFQTQGLQQASITLPTCKGEVSASFTQATDTYTATVCVPANTTATVYLPSQEADTLTVNGEETQATYHAGFVSVTVGSGEWTFTVR